MKRGSGKQISPETEPGGRSRPRAKIWQGEKEKIKETSLSLPLERQKKTPREWEGQEDMAISARTTPAKGKGRERGRGNVWLGEKGREDEKSGGMLAAHRANP